MNNKIFFIAEAGVNHNGDINLAYKLIDTAKEAGADAVKFQTFKAEQVVTQSGEMANYQKKNIGKEESQLVMLKKLSLKEEDFKKLQAYCIEKDIIFMSTPHGSFQSVDFLGSLGMDYFKFGSGDLNNIPLLIHAAKYRKPMFIGTGMATMEEIKESIQAIQNAGNNQITMMHCTTNYPTPFEEANLRVIETMQNELESIKIGFSDHTLGHICPTIAALMGCTLIEKHFTLDNAMSGPDHVASANPEVLKKVISNIRAVERGDITRDDIKIEAGDDFEVIMGSAKKVPTISEKAIMPNIRRSVVLARTMKAGEIIQQEDLELKRPAKGLEPKYYFTLIGKMINKDLPLDHHLTWNDVE